MRGRVEAPSDRRRTPPVSHSHGGRRYRQWRRGAMPSARRAAAATAMLLKGRTPWPAPPRRGGRAAERAPGSVCRSHGLARRVHGRAGGERAISALSGLVNVSGSSMTARPCVASMDVDVCRHCGPASVRHRSRAGAPEWLRRARDETPRRPRRHQPAPDVSGCPGGVVCSANRGEAIRESWAHHARRELQVRRASAPVIADTSR